jgi:hypothetical protein
MRNTKVIELPDVYEAGMHATVTPGQSIRLHGVKRNVYIRDERTGRMVPGERAFDLTFRVGDRAEGDSYNLSYVGRITSIGAKTVTIALDHLDRTVRLPIRTFTWRNWDYAAEQIAARNANEMQCI